MIDKYVGTPFESFNCYELVQKVYKEDLGIVINTFDTDPNASAKVALQFLREVSENWEKLDEPIDYCMVGMAQLPEHPKLVQHVGIFYKGYILHTLEGINAHIVPLEAVGNTIRGYYRWLQ